MQSNESILMKKNIRNYLILLLLQFATPMVFAQQDTLKTSVEETIFEDLVITGQHNPQSINKSIYEVKVINREMIDRLAGNNLADVLNQTLNINITPNSGTGKSSVGMFGLSAAYFKILVDNVPLINDEDFGSRADLTQINLDDIERIEIVEGAMGVDYGTNAMAGVINIITKKRMSHKWLISPTLQEESIGKEYNWNTKGRHVQTLKVAHQFTDKLYFETTYSRNDFKGHWNGRKGEKYLVNDSLRGYEWFPKTQNVAKGTLSYRGEDYSVYFKTEYFNEHTHNYNQVVHFVENPQTAISLPYAIDKIFHTERFYNVLNSNGTLKDWFRFDVSLSFQKQTRDLEQYKYFIRQDRKEDVVRNEYESRGVWYSKGMFSNFIKHKKIDMQLGYEVSEINGFTSVFANQLLTAPVSRKVGSYDFFGSTEFNLADSFSLRTGYRWITSNMFDSQHQYSISAKYVFPKQYELRAIIGNSVRLPSFDELFTYFVDVNHSIRGNLDLQPEKGFSAFLHFKKVYEWDEITYNTKISVGMLNVDNRIDLMTVNTTPLEYQYINANQYRNHSFAYTSDFSYKQLQVNLGLIYNGTALSLTPEEKANDFFYAFNTNLNIAYTLPKYGTTFSIFYKYNGAFEQYRQETDPVTRENKIIKGRIDPIQWMDATVRKNFYNDRLEITLGVRNIFDITSIRNTTQAATAHTSASTSMLMGYGRSYFAKVIYKFKI